MKRTSAILIVCLAVMLALAACAKAPAGSTVTATPTAAPEADKATAGLSNPMHMVDDYAALLAAQPQNMLSDAPEGATGVTYCYIDGLPIVSQIEFTFDGNEYTYRAAATSEHVQSDISGVYDELSQTQTLTSESNVTYGGEYTLRYAQGETKGLATWYYVPTGCQYSLWTPTGCDVTQQIEEVVDLLLPITADAAGNPLSPPVSTPLPAVEAGKLQGTVVDIQSNVITVQLANSNTLQFLLSGIKTPDAKVGDVVEIVYSGNPLDAPEALNITVVTPAPAVPADTAVSGTIYRCTAQSVFVETTSGNIFGFVIDEHTAFSGVSAVCAVGDKVTVTYEGDLSNAPVATKIEITEASGAPAPAPAPASDDPLPTNKKLKGTVTKLATKHVSIVTDTGHHYTFQRDGSTVVTGDYKLDYGCRIRVLYDGYASDGPLAKRIDVLAPPDPTPPDPTPYVPSKYTITGSIAMTAGNALVVNADNGQQYSFLLRSPSISGDIVTGYRVRVTYQVEADGSLNATRIEATPPIVYGPGPVLMDQPE